MAQRRHNFISGAAVLALAVAVTKVLGALYKIPLGNLLGGVAAILNFFLMGWTIQRAVGLDEKAAAAKLKLSQLLRMLMLVVLCFVGIALDCFHTVAVIVPLFFPRIAVAFRPLFDKKNGQTAAEGKDNVKID